MIIATVFSRMFDPLVVGTLAMAVAFAKSGLPEATAVALFALIFLLVAGLPLVLLLTAIRTGRIKNWDLTDRRERLRPLAVELGLILVSGLLIYRWGNGFLVSVFGLMLVWTIGFLLITLVWKISGHVAVNTLAVGLVLSWLGWQYWPIAVIVPLVAWARVRRRDHSLAQVVGGGIYSIVILWVYSLW